VPPDNLVSQMPLEREIELQLRQRFYKHESIPDDDVLNPTVWIRPVPPGGGKRSTPMQRDGSAEHVDGAEAARLWGLPMRTANTDAVGGAYKVVPVVESEVDSEAQAYAYRNMSDDELFEVMQVKLNVREQDLPGRPDSRIACESCGEGVNDRREVLQNGRTLCTACANGAYYDIID